MSSSSRSPIAVFISAASPAHPIATNSPPVVSHPQGHYHYSPRAGNTSHNFDEKSHPVHSLQSHHAHSHMTSPTSRTPSRQSTPTHVHFPSSLPAPKYARPRMLRIANLLRLYAPLLVYIISSLGFVVAIAFWRTEVFTGETLLLLAPYYSIILTRYV